jgi:NAD(P)-dependent dehydrogenase (short-subunit alcohol dehydrogenase family)
MLEQSGYDGRMTAAHPRLAIVTGADSGLGKATAVIDELATDLDGPFLCSQCAARTMIGGGEGGRIGWATPTSAGWAGASPPQAPGRRQRRDQGVRPHGL